MFHLCEWWYTDRVDSATIVLIEEGWYVDICLRSCGGFVLVVLAWLGSFLWNGMINWNGK